MMLTRKQEIAYRLSRQRVNGRRLTQEEIGRIMGISRQSVSELLGRARDSIEQLRRLCIDDGAVELLEILGGAPPSDERTVQP